MVRAGQSARAANKVGENAGNSSNSAGVRILSAECRRCRLSKVSGDGGSGLFMQVTPAAHDAQPNWG
jgi:hypothetical protein